MQVEYGVLIISVALQLLPQRYCIVQKLEPIGLDNDLDCPILTLTNDFYAIPPNHILTPVSVVHQCNDACVFVQKVSSSSIERESVSKHSVVFEHDWSNDFYCLNVFCMHE